MYSEIQAQPDLGQLAMEEFFLPCGLLSLDGRLRYVNKAAAEFSGYSQEELNGKSIFELTPGLTDERWRIFQDIIRQYSYFNVQTYHRHRSGFLQLVEVRAGKLESEGQEWIQITVLSTSGRKRSHTLQTLHPNIRNNELLVLTDQDGWIISKELFDEEDLMNGSKHLRQLVGASVWRLFSQVFKDAVLTQTDRTLQIGNWKEGNALAIKIYPMEMGTLVHLNARDHVALLKATTQSKDKEKTAESRYTLALLNKDGVIIHAKQSVERSTDLPFTALNAWVDNERFRSQLETALQNCRLNRSSRLLLPKGIELENGNILDLIPVAYQNPRSFYIVCQVATGPDRDKLLSTQDQTDDMDFILLQYDHDMRYNYVAGTMLDRFNLTPDDIIGKTLHEVWTQADIEQFEPVYASTLAGKAVVREVLGNDERSYLLSCTPVFNEQLECIGGMVMALDIEDQKDLEHGLNTRISLLSEFESHYRNLVTNLPKAILLVFNSASECIRVEGQGRSQLFVGRTLPTDQNPLPVQDVLPGGVLEEAIQKAQAGYVNIFECKLLSGSWYQWTAIPVSGTHGNGTVLLMGMNIDVLKVAEESNRAYIDELKNINNQLKIENGVRQLIQKNLQEQTKELERKNEELEQFAYVASHDLQEPLRMVSSYTQLLYNRYQNRLDPEAIDFMNFAIEGAQRMQHLINDLLSYSRVGRKEMSFEMINLEVILQIVTRNLQVLIGESGAEIRYGKLPFIEGDSSQLVQLFQNLLSNAIKFRKPGVKPVIRISAKNNVRHIKIMVADNGIGFNMEYKDRVFQIFQRLHTREKFAGTGIGLAICKKIVERHGGQIGVTSEIGEGTTFYFTVPRKITVQS